VIARRLSVRKTLVLVLLAVALAGLWARYIFPVAQSMYLSGNDFLPQYCGGKLAFTPDLYNPQRMQQTQQAVAGMSSPVLLYIRLPYFALLYWPLARLPFPAACAVWQLLSLGALLGFIALWRPPEPRNTILATAFFLPPFIAIFNGQDINFLLLWIALAALDLRQDRPFRAGLWFSLCLAKFHLFLLLPIFILGRRAWRFGGGLCAGGAVLLGIGVLMEGPTWLVRYPAILADNKINEGPGSMPTLHALLGYFQADTWVEIVAVAAVAVCLFVIVRRVELFYALAALLVCGPLLGIHAYVSDCALLLPAGLTLIVLTRFLVIRILCITVMSPPVLSLLKDGYPHSIAVPVLLLALFAAMTYEALRIGKKARVSHFLQTNPSAVAYH